MSMLHMRNHVSGPTKLFTLSSTPELGRADIASKLPKGGEFERDGRNRGQLRPYVGAPGSVLQLPMPRLEVIFPAQASNGDRALIPWVLVHTCGLVLPFI
jgi:hypothetical protein